MNYYEIGQEIRRYRKAHGFSQEALSEMVNISVTHMSHIETGNTKLSLSVLVSLAKALEVSTDSLLFPSTESKRTVVTEKILDILGSCSAEQLMILLDILNATKISLNKYLK